MKTSPTIESPLLKRLRRAATLHRSQAAFAAQLVRSGRRLTLRGTRHSFTFSEIRNLDRQLKVAQSDVPDNLLALLTALRASTGPIPS